MPSAPLRIVHLNTNPHWGGGEKQILELIRGCESHGVVSTLVAHPDGALLERCGATSKCTRIGFHPRRSPRKIMQLCSILKRAQADVLHMHDGKSLAIGVPAATFTGKRGVVHRRISSPVRPNVVSRGLYRAGCIAAYIAVSKAARQSLLDLAIPRKQTIVIPSGVDVRQLSQPADRQRLRAQLGLGNGIWIGTVAALDRKKGVDTFLRAAAIMAAEHANWRYLVVGGGPEHAALRELAQKLGIAHQVKFTGFVGNACQYTSVLDAFAFASLREGSPGVVKEAMALRVPIVAAESPGTDEVITKATGVLIPPQNPGALANALCEVIASPRATSDMVERAHSHVEANYSMLRTVDATIATYEQIKQQSPSSYSTWPRASHNEGTH